MPVESQDDVVLPTAGEHNVTVDLELPLEAQATAYDNGAVGYIDEDVGASLLLQGIPEEETGEHFSAGLRTLITISDSAAPQEYEFPVKTAGFTMTLDPASGGVIVTDADANVAAVVPAPWAIDANGNEVPTWFDVRDQMLVQVVLHDEDTAYPVVADPLWLVPVVLVGSRVATTVIVRAATSTAARSGAAAAARAQTGRAVSSVSQTGIRAAAYRSFTRANLRHNLGVRTGKLPRHCQAHHTMPVAFASQFAAKGININDPRYALWWNSTTGLANNHQSMAAQYNRDWQTFFRNNPRATQQQILNQRSRMVSNYARFYRC